VRKHPAYEDLRRNVTLTGVWRCWQAHEEQVRGGDQAHPLVRGAQEGLGATEVGATRVVVELNKDVVEEFGVYSFAEIGDWKCEALKRYLATSFASSDELRE